MIDGFEYGKTVMVFVVLPGLPLESIAVPSMVISPYVERMSDKYGDE